MALSCIDAMAQPVTTRLGINERGASTQKRDRLVRRSLFLRLNNQLEIESETETYLTLFISSRRNQEVLTSKLLRRRRRRAKCLEVDELSTIAKDRRVEDVVKIYHRTQPYPLAKFPFAGYVEVECEQRGPVPALRRQIAAV